MAVFCLFLLLFVLIVVVVSILPFNSSQKDFCELFSGIDDFYTTDSKETTLCSTDDTLTELLDTKADQWCKMYQLREDGRCYNIHNGEVDFCPGNLGRGCAVAHLLSYFDKERSKGHESSRT